MKHLLITGGAGFVGSSLALSYRQKYSQLKITVLDNLRRRGSELNLQKFKQQNITFCHGDIRAKGDLDELSDSFDLMIEASAEPSVLAGLNGSNQYLIQTNLLGTLNCLEFARQRVQQLIFLSTSRVYSIQPLRSLTLQETATRFEIGPTQKFAGVNAQGISESFPTDLPRSLYGATKLASELFIQEYADTYRLPAIINRCGVIAGPGQFGKTDQGIFTLWVAAHYFEKALKYTGFGGLGKQVRDLLHPDDLFRLLEQQTEKLQQFSGEIFNVGGGRAISTSLLEYTEICQRKVGRSTSIHSHLESAPVDIPLYVSDCKKVQGAFGWQPEKSVEDIVSEIAAWIKREEPALRPLFA